MCIYEENLREIIVFISIICIHRKIYVFFERISFMPLKSQTNNQTDQIICRYKLVVSSSKVADHGGRGRKTLEEKATMNNDRKNDSDNFLENIESDRFNSMRCNTSCPNTPLQTHPV